MENYDIEKLDFKVPTPEDIILSKIDEKTLLELKFFSNSYKDISSIDYSMEISIEDYELVWILLKKKGFYLLEGKTFQKIKELKISVIPWS